MPNDRPKSWADDSKAIDDDFDPFGGQLLGASTKVNGAPKTVAPTKQVGSKAAAEQQGVGQEKRAGESGGTPAASVMMQSAVEYSATVMALDKKVDGKSMLAGPVDKKEVQRQSQLVKEETSKMSAYKEASAIAKEASGRMCFFMRHGERMDRVFPGWMHLAFSEGGHYKPYDLNMPMTLPLRPNYADYANDGPLTEVGYITSQMCGRALRMSNNFIDQVYCSPALRCIQSAHGVLKAARKNSMSQINVEPGLFEFLGWYKDDFPSFMCLDDCHAYGYEVNRDYKPAMSVDDVKKSAATETIADFYKRSFTVVQAILAKHPEQCNILIVAHGPSLDASTRQLLRRTLTPPTVDQMSLMGTNFPYCSMLSLQEYMDNTWGVVERLLPNISYYEHSNRINGTFFNRR